MKIKTMGIIAAGTMMYTSSVFSAIISTQSVNLLSGTYSNSTPLSRVIDGSGLSDPSLSADLSTVTHNSTNANEARLFTSSSASIRLDLGDAYNIEEAFFWNTNTSALNDVSVINYLFLSSDLSTIFDSGNISVPGPLGLIEMPSNLYSPGLVKNVSFVDVTFTRRLGGDSFAPGEIRFTGTISSVPVPAAAWLFSSGLLGLVGFVRRKV